MLALAPQHVRTECVERGCGELIRRLPEQGDEALSHLSGSLVGEGDGGDAVWGDADDAHEVRDAVRDDARLAAAGARDDEQRAVDRGDGVALVVVQAVEDLVGGALWGLLCLRETMVILIAILSAHAYETAASCSDAANSRSTASIIQSSMFV